MDIAAVVATYTSAKAAQAVAVKLGALPAAKLAAAVAPTLMSFTFFSCLSTTMPRLAGAALFPQIGFSVVAFGSLGPNAFVIKNLLLPSLAGLAAYFGWIPESAMPRFFVDYVKHCSMAAACVILAMHVLYCGRAIAVRMVYPAPIVAHIVDTRKMRERALQHPGTVRHSIKSTRTPGAVLDALIYKSATAMPTTAAEAAANANDDGDHHQQYPQQSLSGLDRANSAQMTKGLEHAWSDDSRRRGHHNHNNRRGPPSTFPHCYILYVGGNGELCEVSADTVRVYAQSLGAHGVVFNPRGVGDSTGISVSTSQELVDDTLDVINYLIKTLGAKEENILLFGHSIGGGVSSEIAAKHHRNINIVLDRTFSNLYDAAMTMMPGLPRRLVKYGLPAFFGEFPNDENWAKIPHERKLVSFHAEDQIIKYSGASLARLPQFRQGGADQDHVVELTGRSSDPHNTPTEFFASGHLEVLRRMARFLADATAAADSPSSSSSNSEAGSPDNRKETADERKNK